MEKELFDDLIQGCKEAIEYQKGNLKLKETIVKIVGEDINFYDSGGNLLATKKNTPTNCINDLLQA